MPTITSKKVGIADAQQQPVRYGLGTSGRYTVVPYESTSGAVIDAIAYNCDSLGLQYDVTQTFGKTRIDIVYAYNWAGGGGDPATEMIEKWESVPLQTEKSILESTNYLTQLIINAGQGAQIDVIRKYVEAGDFSELITIDSGTGDILWTPPHGVTSASANLLLAYWFQGQRTVPFTVPALQHTRVVNSNYINRVTVPSRATLYSTPALIADFNVPSGILFQLPTGDTALIYYYINNVAIGGLHQTFGYGWLRSAPKVAQIANFKWQLEETFTYGLWGLDTFGGRLHDV